MLGTTSQKKPFQSIGPFKPNKTQYISISDFASSLLSNRIIRYAEIQLENETKRIFKLYCQLMELPESNKYISFYLDIQIKRYGYGYFNDLVTSDLIAEISYLIPNESIRQDMIFCYLILTGEDVPKEFLKYHIDHATRFQKTTISDYSENRKNQKWVISAHALN